MLAAPTFRFPAPAEPIRARKNRLLYSRSLVDLNYAWEVIKDPRPGISSDGVSRQETWIRAPGWEPGRKGLFSGTGKHAKSALIHMEQYSGWEIRPSQSTNCFSTIG